MSKVLLITNIPAPYRVDLFYYMQTHQQTHEFFVIYTNRNEDNRQWTIDERKLLQSTILKSKIIKRKGEGDVYYLHIPQHLTREITRINPDVVIAWEYNPSALKALLWCKRHGRKFIHLTDGTLHSERNIGRVQKLMRHIDGYTLSKVTKDGKKVQDNDTFTVTCLAIPKHMEAYPADENMVFEGEDTTVKDTWTGYISDGDAILAEPEDYMTLR